MASRRPLVRASGGNRQLPSGDTLDASVTGNAATATKLATARTLSWTGDVTGSTTYDGSGNSSAALTLAASGVTAGRYGPVTVNAKGLVTAASAADTTLVNSLTLTRSDAGSTSLVFNAPTGNYRFFRFLTAGTLRWDFGIDNVAESGSNAGSNFYLNRFDDTGAYIDNPFRIVRATGEVQFVRGSFGGPVKLGTYTLNTLPSASAYSGYEIVVSNASRGWALCRSNGTSWIDLYTQAAVA